MTEGGQHRNLGTMRTGNLTILSPTRSVSLKRLCGHEEGNAYLDNIENASFTNEAAVENAASTGQRLHQHAHGMHVTGSCRRQGRRTNEHTHLTAARSLARSASSTVDAKQAVACVPSSVWPSKSQARRAVISACDKPRRQPNSKCPLGKRNYLLGTARMDPERKRSHWTACNVWSSQETKRICELRKQPA